MATFARSMSQLHSTGCCQRQGSMGRGSPHRKGSDAGQFRPWQSTEGSHNGLVNPPPASRLPGVLGLPNAEYLRRREQRSVESGFWQAQRACSPQPTGSPEPHAHPNTAHGDVEEGRNRHRHADRLAHRLVLWVLYSVLCARPRALTMAPLFILLL